MFALPGLSKDPPPPFRLIALIVFQQIRDISNRFRHNSSCSIGSPKFKGFMPY
jgi:hypothetical protein